MYPDPKQIKHNRVLLSLNDYEHDLLASLANYNGVPIGTLARQLVMREAASVLECGHQDSVRSSVA